MRTKDGINVPFNTEKDVELQNGDLITVPWFLRPVQGGHLSGREACLQSCGLGRLDDSASKNQY